MSINRRNIRQTLTIARRDFIATVFTPTFLVFLFAPLIMSSFGLVGGMGASSVASGAGAKQRIVAILPAPQARDMAAIDARLRPLFHADDTPPALATQAPSGPADAQAHAAFGADGTDVLAVLTGPLDRPHILYEAEGGDSADYLATLAEQTLRAERSGGTAPVSTAIRTQLPHAHASLSGRHQAGFFTVFALFFLTLLLAGQSVGTMAEERSNKVIEILAAAVPLEAAFLGKLIGMFGSAVLFIAFWATIAAQIGHVLPAGAAAGLSALAPAVGFRLYGVLFFAYFTMAYMLLGAVFLSVGAQASTIREIQMLSLPITFTQIGMFALASAAAARPGSTVALIAEVFPLSSPFAMAARAANDPAVWPHALALVWQLLWVAAFVTLGARWFRRGVLKSGSPRRRSRAADIAGPVSDIANGAPY